VPAECPARKALPPDAALAVPTRTSMSRENTSDVQLARKGTSLVVL
jgi:hypothetical protein